MNYEKPELLDLSSNIAFGGPGACVSTGTTAGEGGCAYCTAGGNANGYCSAGTIAHGEASCAAYCDSSGSTADNGACTTSGGTASAACTTGGGIATSGGP